MQMITLLYTCNSVQKPMYSWVTSICKTGVVTLTLCKKCFPWPGSIWHLKAELCTYLKMEYMHWLEFSQTLLPYLQTSTKICLVLVWKFLSLSPLDPPSWPKIWKERNCLCYPLTNAPQNVSKLPVFILVQLLQSNDFSVLFGLNLF